MLHQQMAAPIPLAVPPVPSPLGVLDFSEIARVLGVSNPTLERIIRNDPTFPKLFRIANKRHARLNDLQRWVDQKATAA